MNNKMYFGDYHPGKLQNQRLLCRILKAAGRSIETNDANPMTIRLLIAYDNLYMIKSLASQWHSIRDAPKFLEIKDPTKAPKVSGALSYELIVLPSNHKKFNLIDVHKALFGFFSNLNSAMDRLAYEINDLYEIQYNFIDWCYLFGNAFKPPKYSIPLLEHIVSGQDNDRINWTIECRNRLLHDGILRFELKDSICLPECPSNLENSCWISMETACDNAFWEIVDTIDAIYGSLLRKIEATGLPLRS